jgi:hypothetical protein
MASIFLKEFETKNYPPNQYYLTEIKYKISELVYNYVYI